jgi:hypothetical protein
MTTITLQVPDELAARLAPLRDRLPQLLSIALELFPDLPLNALELAADNPAFAEMIDFLASGPTPAQIAAFKVSPSVQARLEELLDKNREEGLTDPETAELEAYAQVNHLLLLLKARARTALSSPTFPYS